MVIYTSEEIEKAVVSASHENVTKPSIDFVRRNKKEDVVIERSRDSIRMNKNEDDFKTKIVEDIVKSNTVEKIIKKPMLKARGKAWITTAVE